LSNVLKNGLAWLTGQLRDHASETVTYARGYDSVDVPAVFGRKLLRIADETGIRVEWTDMDFLIAADDLVIGGERIEPQRGDIIYAVDPYDSIAFEVMPYGDEPAWRWADPHKSMLRIHAKHIDTEQFYA
jgi:hypothetical protein